MALNSKKTDAERRLHQRLAEERERSRSEARAATKRQRAARAAAARNAEGFADLALDLFDRLGVDPEHPRPRVLADGSEVGVDTDPSYRLRIERLRARLDAVLGAADSQLLEQLRCEDDAGRERRRLERAEKRLARIAARSEVSG
ncbi:hypothetical protein PTQ19_12070 [Microbacterium esteraromaticum]|uniref:hypothetical protein n=1 Tax=Microbacterium esteraromaticum TaxID=57043 RepID=UPI002367A90A|nr:hypothetical protein [Microbacterium esteraromaticum]WDH78247.1 hypothetical protein PTQ19_12070 [Microbacterium esteraromaticum]